LSLCAIPFQYSDAFLLHNSNIFPIICDLFYLSSPSSPSKLISSSDSENKDSEKTDYSKKEFNKTKKDGIDLSSLSSTSWIAFKLLASQCVSWNQGISLIYSIRITVINNNNDIDYIRMCTSIREQCSHFSSPRTSL
jgi:hypothetical protein